VRSKPTDLSESQLADGLAAGWGISAAHLEHAPVGGGSHHWLVTERDGNRWFVTVDDLDQKPWLGDGRAQGWVGLERVYSTAIELRRSGLEFAIAPIATRQGERLMRVSERYTLAVFPVIDGAPGEFGEYDPGDTASLSLLLARLHAGTSFVTDVAPWLSLDIPGRVSLDGMLGALDEAWDKGPLSETARQLLVAGQSKVRALLEYADRLAAGLKGTERDWVITHGEPHGGNLMRTPNGLVLIDWDTVAIAPRERDLWMLACWAGDDARDYVAATGARLDADAIEYFRVRWDLADIAAFADLLRRPHRESEDTVRTLDNLRGYLVAPPS
jgi:hypothetical protein